MHINLERTSYASKMNPFAPGSADYYQDEYEIEVMSEMSVISHQSAEKKSEEYYDSCNKTKSDRKPAEVTEENTGANGLYLETGDDEDTLGNSSHSSQHSRNSIITSGTGVCSYWLRRFIVRICRPHIQSPCCLTSPRLPQFLQRIEPRKRQIICRSLIIIFMIITITFVCLDLIFLKRYLHSWLQSLLGFMEDNPGWGGLLFVGVFVSASLCFFPVPFLSLGAGFVYIELYGLGVGVCVSFLVCYIGYLLGAVICFARSRYLMRNLIVRFSKKYPVVRAVDNAFEADGFRIFLLFRLSPQLPFNALNYIGGITSIRFKDYCTSTLVGVVPGLIWTIFVGATFGSVGSKGVDGNKQLDEKSTLKYLVLGLGIGLGVMGLLGTGIYARRELTKIIIAQQQSRESEEEAVLGQENPQSGCDDDNMLLAENEDYARIAQNRKSPFGYLSMPVSSSSSPASSPVDDERRNWTADNIVAELPIVPVPFIWKMMASPDVEHDKLDANIRRGCTETTQMNETNGLRDIDESRELSFRSHQAQNDFLQQIDVSNQVFNRRRCGTDPSVLYEPNQNDHNYLNSVEIEEKECEVETTSSGSRFVKLFQGLSAPASKNDFPRFNRRRCNSDPNETEKRTIAIDFISVYVETGLKDSRMPHPLHIDDNQRPVYKRKRSASMTQLHFEEKGVDREWFWIFA